MDFSAFRNFVNKRYYEAMKERFLWRTEECPPCVWFAQSKWFLKREFKKHVDKKV